MSNGIEETIEEVRGFLRDMKEIKEANEAWYQYFQEWVEAFVAKPKKDANPEIVADLLGNVILFSTNLHVADKVMYNGVSITMSQMLNMMSSKPPDIEQLRNDFRELREEMKPLLSLKATIAKATEKYEKLAEGDR